MFGFFKRKSTPPPKPKLQPKNLEVGWTTNIDKIKVIDGDSVRVEFSRVLDVRLVGENGRFDAPELGTVAGDRAKAFMKNLLSEGDLKLHIDGSERDYVKDLFTFGRVIGKIYTPDGYNVADLMIEAGHVKEKKNG